MAVSYNGWVANPDPAEIGVVPLVVGGVSFPGGVRGGDIHVIFEWLVGRIHERVEKLRDGWCWGFDYRQNRNANNLSCHSSGTAVDVNAPLHPNGATGTWAANEIRLIREDLHYLEGVIYWGLEFQGTVDPMHFEVSGDASEADVTRVANKIRALTAPKEWWETMATLPPPEVLDAIAKRVWSITVGATGDKVGRAGDRLIAAQLGVAGIGAVVAALPGKIAAKVDGASEAEVKAIVDEAVAEILAGSEPTGEPTP